MMFCHSYSDNRSLDTTLNRWGTLERTWNAVWFLLLILLPCCSSRSSIAIYRKCHRSWEGFRQLASLRKYIARYKCKAINFVFCINKKSSPLSVEHYTSTGWKEKFVHNWMNSIIRWKLSFKVKKFFFLALYATHREDEIFLEAT